MDTATACLALILSAAAPHAQEPHAPESQTREPSSPATSGAMALDVDAVRAEVRRVERLRTPGTELLVATARSDWRAQLGQEALELIDEALELDPDHGPALDFVAEICESVRPRLPLPAPPAVWELEQPDLEAAIAGTFGPAGRMPPAVREVSVWRLGETAHLEFVRATALAKLRDPQPSTRAFAALTLRRLAPGEGAHALIERSLLDSDADARRQAALGLALVGDPEVAAPAVRALSAKNPKLRLHAAQALGSMGFAEAIPPLANALLAQDGGSIQPPPRNHVFFGTQSAYVQDYDVEVATGAGIADPVINTLVEGAVLDVRVIGVSGGGVSSTAHRKALRRSIEQLAGVELGSQKRHWQKWWDESAHNPANASTPSTGE